MNKSSSFQSIPLPVILVVVARKVSLLHSTTEAVKAKCDDQPADNIEIWSVIDCMRQAAEIFFSWNDGREKSFSNRR